MYTLNIRLDCRHDKEDYESDITFFNYLLIELISSNFKYYVTNKLITFGSHYWDDLFNTWVIPIETTFDSRTIANDILNCVKSDPAMRCKLSAITVDAG